MTSDGANTSSVKIRALRSTQEKTDSRVILYCMFAREKGFQYVRVNSPPDTDILFILLHYAAKLLHGITVLLETGKGSERKCIDVSNLFASLTPCRTSALLGLHAFTGCDSTSAFKRKWKVKPIKLLFKTQRYIDAFPRLGYSWEFDDCDMDTIQMFVCALYGNARIRKVNELRYVILQRKYGGYNAFKMSANFDLSALPPCLDCLEQHVKRANYQVAIWKQAHIPEPSIPNPNKGHGWTYEDGTMQPLRTSRDVLPKQLVDILESTVEDIEDTEGKDNSDNGRN